MWRRNIGLASIRGREAKKGAIGALVLTLIVALGALGLSVSGRSLASSASRMAAPDSPPAAVLNMQSDQRASQKESSAGTSSTGASSQAPAAEQAAAAQAKPWDRMIIRTATLQVTVKDVNGGIDAVRALAAAHDGLVLTSDSRQDGEYTVSTISIEVPSQEFDHIMPQLRKLNGLVKKVTSENVTSSDVTEEYTDLQSQLRNLQATEARMLVLQGKADKLEDVLTVDRELRQVQGDIEKAQGRINFLSKRSDMSTITISLSPDVPPVEPIAATSGWQPGEVVQRAWNGSLDMLAGVASGALTVVVFFWWTIPLLLLGFWALGRARRRVGTRPAAQPASTTNG